MEINNYTLELEADSIVNQALVSHNEFGEDAVQVIHEVCLAHQWATYYAKAFQLCLNCDTDEGEDYLEETGDTHFTSISDHATKVAYATLLQTSMKKYFHYFD